MNPADLRSLPDVQDERPLPAAWHEYLERNGASLVQGRLAPFSDATSEARAALHGDVITDLGSRALIAASGADAAALLQGQLTNDIEKVTGTRSQLSAWCSVKGRVLALFRIWRSGEVYYLEMPADLLESVLTRLRRYVLRAAVLLEDRSRDSAIRIGVSGTRVAESMREVFGPLPGSPDETRPFPGATIIRLRGETPRFQICASFDRATALWERCRRSATPVADSAWTLLDIRAGVASIPATLSERFLPQMLNLQALNGLSFSKGCYSGQEVVARAQYLGRLKRRLYRATVRTSAPVSPGDGLYLTRDEGGTPVGAVVNAEPSEDPEAWEMLAVLGIEAARSGDVRLHHVLGPLIECRTLPYPLDAPSA